MKNKIAVFLATWFYSGCIPFVLPGGVRGTHGAVYASLSVIPLCYGIMLLPDKAIIPVYLIATLMIFLIGLWAVPRAEAVLGLKMDWTGKFKMRDQNQIVIDEVFGMLVSCFPLVLLESQSLFQNFILAFLIFRFLDTIKPFPVNLFDRIKSAEGVMLDDFMAGLYTVIALLLILVF